MLRARIQRKARRITEPVRAQLSQLLRSQRNRQWLAAVLAWAAALVTVAVVASLALEAVTLVREQRVLRCSAAESVAHMHDESCYDAAGRLVCPLRERDEHNHSAACYDADGSLVCEQEETIGYHTHGAGCFVELSSLPRPSQLFDDVAGDVHVTVEAPEGAFPEGTTMTVQPVNEDDVREMTEGALGKSLDKLAAVDITFLGPAGVEVNPEVPVTVTMSNGVGSTRGRFVVFHVGDEGEVGMVTQYAPATPGQVSFKTDSFSIYVMAVKKLQQTITASDGRTYEVSVTYTEEAGLPEDVELAVREIEESDSSFAGVFKRAKTAATSTYEDATVTSARFLDISLKKGSTTLEPLAPVEVNIVLKSGIALSDATSVVHFINSRKVEVVNAEVAAADQDLETGVDVTFTTDKFSVFGVVEMTLEKFVLASDGQTYHVTATYGAAAGVPNDAELVVEELVAPDSSEEGTVTEAYDNYVSQAEAALGWDVGSATYARLFDIKIVDRSGEKVRLAAPVNVRIELADREDESVESAETQVVHFADGSNQPEVIQGTRADGDTVSFDTQGFSVYAIVDAPAPAVINVQTAKALSELNENINSAFYLSYGNPANYFTSDMNGNSCFIETRSSDAAAEWFFEIVSEANHTYRLYTMVDGEKRYVNNPSGNLAGLVSESEVARATVFQLTLNNGGTFLFKINNANKWLQHSGSGGGIRFWTDANNPTNSKITLSYASSYKVPKDPYHLDGLVYGIAYHNDTASSTSLSTNALTVSGKKRLGAIDMLMREDTVYGTGLMLVAEGTDITEWTFESVEEDKYYITTTIGGSKKYLTINGENVTLSDTPDPTHSLVRVLPGTGTYAGKYSFTVGGYALNLPGTDTDGFNAVSSNRATIWMNLVQKSKKLTDEDFKLYAAKKVSISDTTKITDGKQVIIYTRVWNEVTERYEFYVVDHDGSLLRCYDAGDAIKWIGNKRNSALWKFTEHFNSGVTTYYYDLQNVQYGTYISPLLKNAAGQPQVVSTERPGLNLNGRRYKHDYTTILTWDDTNYEYVGLKVENGAVVPCALDEAEDFYFAVVTTLDDVDALTEVETIDSARYGITMKMIDFNNKIVKDRDSVQYNWFGGEKVLLGLLSTNLGADGYPTRTSLTGHNDGASFSTLFNDMTEVNHLFIESVYNESGYFEYDSTQNFAHLNEDGTFTVYDQIGAITGSNEHKNTREHGQFMPYEDISAEKGYAIDASGNIITAQTDVLKNPLPDENPRKGEKMYNIGSTKDVDYFFGMEMSASFTQTSNGLDAWGHDIIFEFSGDDDFWFYVDGELVLDLGGVHEAQAGSINFRTGEVICTYNVGNEKVSTLYEVFKSNYESRGMSADEVQSNLSRIFIKNEEGNYVFKDYSSHTMRMFYMERGAGASNLHMRFNLAAVRPGTFLLSKKLSGTEVTSNSLIEFPYQIWYYTQDDGEAVPHLLDGDAKVVYEGTNTQVNYAETFTPAGGTSSYDNVFFLKPGETAEIELPESATNYYVVECGVNTSIYDHVSANGTDLVGAQTDNAGRYDYQVDPATLEDRSEIEYVNHVADGAMRSLEVTKRLWDQGGQRRLVYPEDTKLFTFRLYLGTENDSADNLSLANMYPYHVKDPNGNYCAWDATTGFVSLNKTNLADLTEEELALATFTTSINGSISKIPADHTVEVRNLIASTQYKVEERDEDIPRGYTLRLGDGYTRVDVSPEIEAGTTPYGDTIQLNETPQIEIRNQKGWGLTVQKEWTDVDFMKSHDPIYFAVYLQNGSGQSTLQEDSVRQLTSGQTEIYYFFESLETGKRFSDYVIREVVLTPGADGIKVDASGKVTGFDAVTPVDEGGQIEVDGVTTNGTSSTTFTYNVSYTVGEQTLHNENVRTDTITNSRPGIELVKTDWSGTYLAGAVFTLKDQDGTDVSAPSYTSGSNGRITIAYLAPGTYTLTETVAPRLSAGLPGSLTIFVDNDYRVSASGSDQSYYTVTEHPADSSMVATITIKNRPSSFQIKKVDASTGNPTPLEGVHFALYPQVKDDAGNPTKDYYPVSGYEDLVTNNNGILTKINAGLDPGTYYLEETQALEGYDLLDGDLCFTMGEDGTVTINDVNHRSWLQEITTADGKVTYVIEIPNDRQKKFRFKKVDSASWQTSHLEGAEFDLYQVVDGVRERTPLYERMISGADGILVCGGLTEFMLPVGTYHLVETKAPAGYILKTDPVIIQVNPGSGPSSAMYEEGTTLSDGDRGISYNASSRTFELLVTNSTGYELPKTGGPGTLAYTIAGTTIVIASVIGFTMHKRKNVL